MSFAHGLRPEFRFPNGLYIKSSIKQLNQLDIRHHLTLKISGHEIAEHEIDRPYDKA